MINLGRRSRSIGVLAVLSLARAASANESTALVEAVARQDAPAIAAALEHHMPVNAPQPDGATALHWAAHWDDVALARRLIVAGAAVNVRNAYGITPLWLAAENGSAALLQRLLESGADANAAPPTGITPLMMAARTGRAEAVEVLLAHGADLDAEERETGQTALMWAVAAQHPAVVQAFLAHGAAVDRRTKGGFTSLMFAVREGNVELAGTLLDHGADINASDTAGNTPLLVSTVRGQVSMAMWLLDHGAAVDGNLAVAGYTPLHWAVGKHESYTTYNYPSAPGEWRALAGLPDRPAQLSLVDSLLAYGANVNAATTIRTMPFFGTTNSTPAIGRGATPFYIAAATGEAVLMRLLVAHGANPLTAADDGSTPLIAAAGILRRPDFISRVPESAYLEAVQTAVELGNPLEAADKQGMRAMHFAAMAGFTSIIQFLADQGADLNPKTVTPSSREGSSIVGQRRGGITPLGYAEGGVAGIYVERPEAAALLRKLGAVSSGAYGNLEQFNETIKNRAAEREGKKAVEPEVKK